MSNEGGLLETLFERFPADNPRPLLSSIFWLGAIGGLIFTGFVVVSAFTVDAKAGFIAFFVNGVGLFLWLAMLRIMLEAAGALFDIRDQTRGFKELQASVAAINATIRSADDGKKSRKSRSPRSAAHGSGPSGQPIPDGPEALAEIIMTEVEGGGDVRTKDLCRGWDVTAIELSEALKQLEAEGRLVRTGFGVVRYVGNSAAVPHQVAESRTDEVETAYGSELQVDERAVPETHIASTPESGNACSQCGAEGRPGQRFCSKCGNQLLSST